jgi:hypothetical protein
MNEKIKQLAINSQLVSEYKGELISGWQEGVDLTEYLEKFAELIVRECANWIENTDSDPDIGADDAQALREHFGVE